MCTSPLNRSAPILLMILEEVDEEGSDFHSFRLALKSPMQASALRNSRGSSEMSEEPFKLGYKPAEERKNGQEISVRLPVGLFSPKINICACAHM